MKTYCIALIFLFGIWISAFSIATLKDEKEALVLEDVLRIEGEIEKPEAYFILQRKNFDHLLNIETVPQLDAIQEIVDVVESDIF